MQNRRLTNDDRILLVRSLLSYEYREDELINQIYRIVHLADPVQCLNKHKDWEEENAKTLRKIGIDAVAVSSCCQALLELPSGEEGTNHFTCIICKKPCDPYEMQRL